MTVSLEEEPEIQTQYSTSLNSLLDQILNCIPKDFAFFRNPVLIWTSFRLEGYTLKIKWEKSSHLILYSQLLLQNILEPGETQSFH